MSNIKTLETERLILKEVKAEHIDDYQKYFADYDVISHLAATVPWPYPEDGAKYFLENEIFPDHGKEHWMWGLFLKTNPDELIGAIDLQKDFKLGSNRGFWLGKPFWGNGYMTEATTATNDHAFAELGFDKLILGNALGNDRSRRVKEKTGAKLLRVEPFKFVNPEYTEHEVWELRKEDWIAYRNKTKANSYPAKSATYRGSNPGP